MSATTQVQSVAHQQYDVESIPGLLDGSQLSQLRFPMPNNNNLICAPANHFSPRTTAKTSGSSESANSSVATVPRLTESSDTSGSSPTIYTPRSVEVVNLPLTYPEKKAPVWEQERLPSSFKLRDIYQQKMEAPFTGAFDVLAALNPEAYQLPWGVSTLFFVLFHANTLQSHVVAIKCQSAANILISIERGLWACPGSVTKRISTLFDDKRRKEKVLLLFSVSGR